MVSACWLAAFEQQTGLVSRAQLAGLCVPWRSSIRGWRQKKLTCSSMSEPWMTLRTLGRPWQHWEGHDDESQYQEEVGGQAYSSHFTSEANSRSGYMETPPGRGVSWTDGQKSSAQGWVEALLVSPNTRTKVWWLSICLKIYVMICSHGKTFRINCAIWKKQLIK